MNTPSSDTLYEESARLILYHKQATSARTLFLRLPHGGISAFEPLPELAQLIEPGITPVESSNVHAHPTPLAARAEQHFSLPGGSVEIDAEFRHGVDIPGGPVAVHLGRFTTIDPPFDEVAAQGARFIALTEARDLSPAELALLQSAYAQIMEG